MRSAIQFEVIFINCASAIQINDEVYAFADERWVRRRSCDGISNMNGR